MNDTPAAPPPAGSRPRLRWLAAPFAAVILVGGLALASSFAGAQAPPPVLPAISAEELAAKMIATSPEGVSGTVRTRTDLGLPSLDSLGAPGEGSGLLTSLLAPQKFEIQAAPGGRFRLAMPEWMAETGVISNGSDVWVWQSRDQTVTHLAIPPHEGGKAAGTPVPTPEVLAREALAAADATTRVFVRGTATVAGRPAYELVLAPRTPVSLVADVVIDVDSATGLPLRVQVLAKDSSTPALDVGFTDVSFGVPPASAFEFTPPSGATVREATSPEQLLMGDGDGDGHHRDRAGRDEGAEAAPPAPAAAHEEPKVLGEGWETVVAVTGVPSELSRLGSAVSGPWGSGRLVTTTLVSALVLDDGTALIGAVTPERLQAAVGELRAVS